VLASPHPSSVSLPCRPSISSEVQSIGVEGLSLGSALCRWVLPSVVGLHPLSLGSAFRRWVLPFTIGFYLLPLGSTLSSLGSAFRRWVIPFDVGLYPSILGFFVIGFLHRWMFATPVFAAITIVHIVSHYAGIVLPLSSLAMLAYCHHRTRTVVVEPIAVVEPISPWIKSPMWLQVGVAFSRGGIIPLFGALSLGAVSGGEMGKEVGKMNHDESHGSFSGRTSWASHSLGPPLMLLFPKSFVKLEPPTSLWKGEGRWGSTLFVRAWWGCWRSGPHPSREGRGHFPGCRVWLRANGWQGRVVVVVVG
jgi:hypothetical protein